MGCGGIPLIYRGANVRYAAQVQRVTLRRRHAYATRSNKIKIVKTPGGKLTVQYPLLYFSKTEVCKLPSFLHFNMVCVVSFLPSQSLHVTFTSHGPLAALFRSRGAPPVFHGAVGKCSPSRATTAFPT
mmetsp:Transcript_1543/g.4189  ORF Transcript_1543/g.4189 Transcript_1543/m.4189 type:complete len:128 (-) Transcript_1543:122-505(-)